MRTGKIVGVQHQMGSGIAQLLVEDAEGDVRYVPAEAGPLFRALRDTFDGNWWGRYIAYETDDLGVMLGFTPEET